ncbi:MAG: cytochrome P460 family protein [Geobacteraceae bacterium]|nr:cytochrome P460 family protein [Geobacteraceae bacterium]
MKKIMLLAVIMMIVPNLTRAANAPVAPNGIALISGYRSWEAIAPSYRADKNHIRIIFGNAIAIKAMKEKIRPFPDGTVMAKVAWNKTAHPKFPVATVPGTFSQVEFMVKDSIKYRETGGWGFARFVGNELKPYGTNANFVQECFGCHQPVKGNDYVFTSFAAVP